MSLFKVKSRFKYCQYTCIAIFAIFVDYRLHYFCTILYLVIKNIFVLSRYHIPSDSLEVVSPSINSSGSPSGRYGHSMIGYNVSVDFGWVIVSDPYSIDT